jgi:hypothetical protein
MLVPSFWQKMSVQPGCTKHIHTRYHFAHEFVEDGMIKIVFVKTQDNKADIVHQECKW